MKNLNRDCYQNDTRGGLSITCDNEIQQQINQAWKEYEQAKAEKIKIETDCAWAEYESLFNYGEDIEEENDADFGLEELEYKKDKKRLARRRAKVRANNQIIRNAEIARKSLTKRAEKDRKNRIYHNFYKYEGEGLIYHINGKAKSCRAKADALIKRVEKLQP